MKKLNYFWMGVLGLFGAMNAQAQALPSTVLDASQYFIRGCEVVLNQDGYNLLYFSDQSSSRYVVVQQDLQLAQDIQFFIQRGTCAYKSQREISIMRTPQLIDDFAHFAYGGCRVERTSDGYNSFYVRNSFIGYYQSGSQDLKLRSVLADYVMIGACVYGQTPPPPPPQYCTCSLANQWGNFRDTAVSCQLARQEVLNECSHSNPHAVCQGSQVFCR